MNISNELARYGITRYRGLYNGFSNPFQAIACAKAEEARIAKEEAAKEAAKPEGIFWNGLTEAERRAFRTAFNESDEYDNYDNAAQWAIMRGINNGGVK